MSEPERKRSLFYQRMKISSTKDIKNDCLLTTDCTSLNHTKSDITATTSVFGNKSYVLSGGDADAIHRENVAKLEQLSKEEIEETRKTLLNTISADQLEFLRTRRKMSENRVVDCSCSVNSNKQTEPLAINNAGSSLHMDPNLINNGLHMNVIEPEKLEWMTNVPNIVQSPNLDSWYSARFNFEGFIMPYTEDKGVSSNGLYHHGEEPHRPGYTVEELFQLSRSSVMAQRVMAINTLAAIVEKDWIFQLRNSSDPIIKILLDHGLFVLLRFALDDNARPVHTAALRALSAVLWNNRDMVFIRRTYGMFNLFSMPSFEITNEELKDADKMTDEALLNLDVIRGALRTNILNRFRYLLADPEVEETDINCIIKCLTRICFHSNEATLLIVTDESLMKLLFSRCTSGGKFERCASKFLFLLKVICCRSKDFTELLIDKYDISRLVFDTLAYTGQNSISRMTECLQIWHIFLSYNIKTEYAEYLLGSVFSLLQSSGPNPELIDKSRSVIFEYISSICSLLILLLTHFLAANNFELKNISREFAFNWLTYCFDNRPDNTEKLIGNLTDLIILVNPEARDRLIEKFYEYLQKCNTDISAKSALLSDRNVYYIDNLPSLRISLCFFENQNYNFLLTSFLRITEGCSHNETSVKTLTDKKQEILSLFSVPDYLRKIVNSPNVYENSHSWSTSADIYQLYLILMTYNSLNTPMPPPSVVPVSFYFILATISNRKEFLLYLFEQFIFSRKLYQFINPQICEKPKISEILDRANQVICKYYLRIFNLSEIYEDVADEIIYDDTEFLKRSCKNFESFMHPDSMERELPVDWIYYPLIKVQNMESDVNPNTIMPVLEFILLVETVLKNEIPNLLPKSMKFCRLASVFLHEKVFHDFGRILRKILKQILSSNDELIFDKPISRISSFYDFYSQLCEQFCSVGYCNEIFGMFLLIPLQQMHDVQLRKLVWSEHSLILRLLRIPINRLLVSIENFLTPCETNIELLHIYLNHLASGNVKQQISPVLYIIALHHVGIFIIQYQHEEVAKQMRKNIDKIGNQEMRDLILKYTESRNDVNAESTISKIDN